MLPDPYDFDAQKTYRVPVVLFSFSDLDFSMDNPAAYYDRLFNEKGFNEGMKPLSEGGKTYLVRSTGNNDEYYLLENRRQTGWDYGCPGNGLLIFHVDFDRTAWLENYVNTDVKDRYGLFHASGKDFRAWCPQNNGKDLTRWTEDNWLRSSYLSTSAYPYTDPETLAVNNSLTDESSPAATLFTAAADGREFMGKPITNIQLAADGTISFDFMKGTATSVHSWQERGHNAAAPIYDLQGRRLSAPAKGIYLQGGRLIIDR